MDRGDKWHVVGPYMVLVNENGFVRCAYTIDGFCVRRVYRACKDGTWNDWRGRATLAALRAGLKRGLYKLS